MKKTWSIIFILFAIVGLITYGYHSIDREVVNTKIQAVAHANETIHVDNGEIIVQYNDSLEDANEAKLVELSVEPQEKQDVLEELRNRHDILYAEENVAIKIHELKIPNDEYLGHQWYLDSINMKTAWNTNLPATTQNKITVAVIDSGVDRYHPDLRGNVISGYNFIDNNTDTSDDHGHGTAIAGVIAATYNNQIGIAGVSGDRNVDILPLKVAGQDGKGQVSHMIKAIEYAVDQGVDMINISMGTESYSRILEETINHALEEDIFVVASAGNEGNSDYIFPAAYDNVLSVGAVAMDHSHSKFSNYNDKVDLVAPGERILATSINDSYAFYDGTSLSAAVISGAAAYVKAAYPSLSASDMTSLLKKSATDLGAIGKDAQYGYGLIDLREVLLNIESSSGGNSNDPHEEDEESKSIFSIPTGYKELEELKVDGNDFYLQVKFNVGIDFTSINDETVYILDRHGEKLDVNYELAADSADKKLNVMTASTHYEIGQPYFLFVDQGVISKAGKPLAQPIVTQFMWDEETGILSIN